MTNKIFLITPPFTQLNTPYPATAYLKGFLNTKGISSYQSDLGIEVILALFSRSGLTNLFDQIQLSNTKQSENAQRIIALKEYYITKIDAVISFLPIEEYFEHHLSVLKELLRVSKVVFYNIQIVTGSKRPIFKIMGELNEFLKDIVIWDKGHGQPAMAERVLNRRTELILIFDKENAISRQFENANFKRGTLDDIWMIKRGKKISAEHGAVFPEELVYTILNNFSNEGDIVYDPFMGAGTTAVVAAKMKRKYIGSELSEEYIKVAENRIKATKGTLFDF